MGIRCDKLADSNYEATAAELAACRDERTQETGKAHYIGLACHEVVAPGPGGGGVSCKKIVRQFQSEDDCFVEKTFFGPDGKDLAMDCAASLTILESLTNGGKPYVVELTPRKGVLDGWMVRNKKDVVSIAGYLQSIMELFDRVPTSSKSIAVP